MSSNTKHSAYHPMRKPLEDKNKTMVMLAWGAILSGWVTMPIGPIAGVVIAFVGKNQTTDFAAHTHFNKIIVSFWVGCFFSILSLLIVMLSVDFSFNRHIEMSGIFAFGMFSIFLGLYFTYISVKGIIKASNDNGYR